MNSPVNPYSRAAILLAGLAVFFLCITFSFALIGIEIQDGGGALFALGTVGFCGTAIFIMRAMLLAGAWRSMHSGRHTLAVWTYASEIWTAHVEREHGSMRESARTMSYVALAAAGLAAAGILMGPGFGTVLSIILGIVAFMTAAAAFIMSYLYREHARPPHEVIITDRGIIAGRFVHRWSGEGSRMRIAAFESRERIFTVSYSKRTVRGRGVSARLSRETVNVRVPVPAGQEDLAATIVEYFSGNKEARRYFGDIFRQQDMS